MIRELYKRTIRPAADSPEGDTITAIVVYEVDQTHHCFPFPSIVTFESGELNTILYQSRVPADAVEWAVSLVTRCDTKHIEHLALHTNAILTGAELDEGPQLAMVDPRGSWWAFVDNNDAIAYGWGTQAEANTFEHECLYPIKSVLAVDPREEGTQGLAVDGTGEGFDLATETAEHIAHRKELDREQQL